MRERKGSEKDRALERRLLKQAIEEGIEDETLLERED